MTMANPKTIPRVDSTAEPVTGKAVGAIDVGTGVPGTAVGTAVGVTVKGLYRAHNWVDPGD
jgi:hypothetical protein